MRVDWDQNVAGADMMQVRDILRFASRYHTGITRGAIAARILVDDGVERRRDRFTITEIQYQSAREEAFLRADVVLDALVAGGVLGEPGGEMLRLGCDRAHPGYELTPAGFGLLRATKTKRITRKAADAAIALLRRAVAEINADPVLMFDVERIAIYGSHLTDAADLGDVDVAYALKRRWDGDDDYRARKTAFEAVHQPPANQTDIYEYQYDWHEKVVLRKLRTKACIQLTDMRHVEQLGCARLEILPHDVLVEALPEHSFERGEAALIDDGGEARRTLDERILTRAEEMRAEIAASTRAWR